MKTNVIVPLITILVLMAIAGGCAAQSSVDGAKRASVVIYESPTCGCCAQYNAYLKKEGFDVEARYLDDLSPVKNKYEIPQELLACHTATVGGYIIEGHVPVEVIEKLLTDKPAIRGVALPGMPAGSPGMPGGTKQPFDIYALTEEGSRFYMTY
ncbi:MAG: DUF411 domain-containing protein [Dehalococcoidia bacterium]